MDFQGMKKISLHDLPKKLQIISEKIIEKNCRRISLHYWQKIGCKEQPKNKLQKYQGKNISKKYQGKIFPKNIRKNKLQRIAKKQVAKKSGKKYFQKISEK